MLRIGKKIPQIFGYSGFLIFSCLSLTAFVKSLKKQSQQSQKPKSKDWRIMLLIFFLSKTKKITQENPDTLFISLFSPPFLHQKYTTFLEQL